MNGHRYVCQAPCPNVGDTFTGRHGCILDAPARPTGGNVRHECVCDEIWIGPDQVLRPVSTWDPDRLLYEWKCRICGQTVKTMTLGLVEHWREHGLRQRAWARLKGWVP